MIVDPVTVRAARPDEGPAVLAVLDDAAAWLAEREITQWPAAFRPEYVEPALGSGRMWLAESGDAAVATFALEWVDPLWDDDGRAGYLHRFAVRRGRAGIGGALLDWIDGEIRRHGRDRLRLDCDAANTRLRAYYADAGFEHRGDVLIPMEFVRWSSGQPLVSRYERPVVG